jgi:hypothetical protein
MYFKCCDLSLLIFFGEALRVGLTESMMQVLITLTFDSKQT